MGFVQNKRLLAITGSAFGVAALLGASLGLAAAGDKGTLTTGPQYIGGPFADMAPEKFTSCLPEDNWSSIYIWDAQEQQWQHWVNPAKHEEYINDPSVGGIETIPRFAGVAILIDSTITNAFFPDTNAQNCP
jgi:hypothetical protein